MYNVASILGKTFKKAFNRQNTENRFYVKGMYPLNENMKMNSYSPMSLTDLTFG
jgi:hypothetical protein